LVPENVTDLLHSPEEICRRAIVPGHWEGILIHWCFNRSSVGTAGGAQNPASLFLCKIGTAMVPRPALDSFTRQMKRLPAAIAARALTMIAGSEMACHPDLPAV